MKPTSILPVKIISTGIFMPGEPVTSTQLEVKYNKSQGWTDKHSGVQQRHWAGPGDTCTSMGVAALQNALTAAGMVYDDLDLVVSASATYDYPIPHNACLIQSHFESSKPVPGFDIDATCLGWIVAMEVCSKLLDGVRYKKIAIVCSEIASTHLNPEDWETFSLLGDGAFACILGSADEAGQGLIHADMKTYPQAATTNIVEIGGNAFPFHAYPIDERRFFKMNGKHLLKLAYETVPSFINGFFKDLDIRLSDVKWIFPHQASLPGLLLSERLLGMNEDQLVINIQKYGNTLSCAAGIALHETLIAEKVQRGDLIMIVGTGAGFSIGGSLWRF